MRLLSELIWKPESICVEADDPGSVRSRFDRAVDRLLVLESAVPLSIPATSHFQRTTQHDRAVVRFMKVWSELGYAGPSFKFGGYLERGFNDIDWLSEG